MHINTDTLWFVGAGMAIIFGWLLNFVAIDRGGSKFTKAIAVVTNAFNCNMFCIVLIQKSWSSIRDAKNFVW